MADAHTRHTPAGTRWFCNLCPWEGGSIDDTTGHLETHDDAQRWPDGGVAIDTSGIAELMLLEGEERRG